MHTKVLHLSVFVFFAIAVAIILFVSCRSLWLKPKPVVTIAVSKTPLSAPFYIAKAIDAFDDTCVCVKYQDVVGGQKAFTQVVSGDVDFGTVSDSVIAFQSLSKNSFVTHGMFVQSDNDVKLITRRSDNINSTMDLKGKRIGVTKVTASEYFLTSLLALEGLNVKDVELLHYPPEKLITGFINNEIDAFVPWEPFAFNSVELLGDKIKVHETKSLNMLSFNLISLKADKALVDKAKCIMKGLAIAINYISSNPAKAKKIIINELQLEPEFIDWVWPDYIFKLGLNQSLLLSLKSQAMWAAQSSVTPKPNMPHVEDFIDSRAMLKVSPRAVNIPH